MKYWNKILISILGLIGMFIAFWLGFFAFFAVFSGSSASDGFGGLLVILADMYITVGLFIAWVIALFRSSKYAKVIYSVAILVQVAIAGWALIAHTFNLQ